MWQLGKLIDPRVIRRKSPKDALGQFQSVLQRLITGLRSTRLSVNGIPFFSCHQHR
jgi:hypothetical protein